MKFTEWPLELSWNGKAYDAYKKNVDCYTKERSRVEIEPEDIGTFKNFKGTITKLYTLWLRR